MKATVYDLMDAIGNVSDYVVMETSARSRQVKERAHIRWGVTAACICYVAVMALIGIYKSGLSAIEPPSGMFLPGKEVMGPSDIVGTVGTDTDTADTDTTAPRPCDSILKVLRGEGEFRTSNGEYFDIKHLYAAISPDFADVELDFDHAVFAPIDMDGDGTFEAVFKINYGGENYVILYTYNGEVRSEVLYERSCSSLKADGTFFWWDITEFQGFSRIESFTDSGAVTVDVITRTSLTPDGGYFMIESHWPVYFTADGTKITDHDLVSDIEIKLLHDYNWDHNDDYGPLYLVDNEKVSEAEYEKAVNEQNAKEDVTWYDLADMDDLDLEKYYGDGSADAVTSTDTDAAEPDEHRQRSSILNVLRGEGEFAQIMGSHGGRRFVDHITLQEWCDENSKGIVPSDVSLAFTVIDLDGNGSNEAVVSLTFDEGEYSVVNEYLILYLYDGEVYGISTVRRGFDGLAADGTFLFDDGEYKEWRKITALTGIYDGRLLPGADYLYDVYMCVDPYAKDGPYFINGAPVSESEFDKALEEQRAKEGVVWYDLADIDDLDLEQYFDDGIADTDTSTGTDTVDTETAEPETTRPHDTDTDTTEPEAPRPRDSILKVLEGEGEFYNNIRHSDGTYSECLVHIVGDCFYSPYMGRDLKIARFALVDMDGDGIEEAVLDCTLIDDDRYTYETVVLHLYKGEVHSYWFVPRAFYNLKADGTFEWEDGPNGGFRKITSFTDTDSIVDDFTYQDYHSDEGPYFVNNNTVSEAEFEKEYARLREKEDAVWHDFEGADFEQYFE